MDELEISGKRYISTHRAAKEYKYHADYIGQLIRGKKVSGRKVGRSWYVELDSLVAAYLGKEGSMPARNPEVAVEIIEESLQPAPAPQPVVAVVQPALTPLPVAALMERIEKIESMVTAGRLKLKNRKILFR